MKRSPCAACGGSSWSARARRARAWRPRWKKSSARGWRKKSSLRAGSMCRPIASGPLKRIRLHAGPAGGCERADCGRRGRRDGNPAAGRIAHAGRPVPLPALRRRLGPAAGAGGSDLAGGQACRYPASQRGRREHRATQYGPQATQPDQRRRARPGVPRGAAGFAHHLRRARRSAGPDRLRPDGRGPLDCRRTRWPCSSSSPRAKRAFRRPSSRGSSGRSRDHGSRPSVRSRTWSSATMPRPSTRRAGRPSGGVIPTP